MKKRVISVFTAVCLMFCVITGKLYGISNGKAINVSESHSLRVKTIVETRGQIYDRYTRKLTNTENENYLIIKPNTNVLSEIKNIEDFEEIKKQLEKGELAVTKTKEYNKTKSTESVLLLSLAKRYSDNLLCHITGYVNGENDGVCGIEKGYNEKLKSASGTVSAVYETDALGRVLLGEDTEIRYENYDTKSGVVLTVNKDFQKITENALNNSSIEKGAVIILDVNTSEILACASVPVFNRNAPEKSLKNKNAPFINRAFTAYSAGSVFKVVTAAAAIENGKVVKNFNCSGNITKNGTLFYCNKRDGHGEVDAKKALTVSCNPFFIELASVTGAENILNTAKKLGFGTSYDLGGITTDKGNLPSLNELNSDASVGNFGFGQGSLLATPLQVALCYAVIANGGIFREPALVRGFVNAEGDFVETKSKTKETRVLKEETCETLKNYLNNVVNEGTGTNAKSEYFSACGKTATAETGQKNENGEKLLNSWFVGFFPFEKPEYVICILKENGASGSIDDAPVFKEISENLYFLNNENITGIS